ncbi:ACP S-malonyltransferase [Tropicibacter sp. R15_0]|uniref:ACP S-malonyltransferase n=1 Tax=Tropicibacter sp. R15_0 TaxID=2821101 RepID=UPI001ADA7E49|nr:ACP S-malonyltransferase [Tropicibacter sp. R15_0]MBO9463667.1 ACP S-malonyltransferase [Tropicibacter sp. R15_0]
MIQTGWIFPGQGAQSARMAAKFIGRGTFETVLDTIEDLSGKPVRDFTTKMADPDLKRTDRAQLAIFAMSSAIAACLREEGLSPAFVAGHSLGHFSALAASGALSLEDATQLVVERGQLMLFSGERVVGGMGVVQGLSADVVSETLKEAKLKIWPANLNLPEQIVVSGAVEDLDPARAALTAKGGKWVALNVSGAFHSPLLANEARAFADRIKETAFSTSICPVLSNKDGSPMRSARDIQDDLLTHMTGQVNWTAVMSQIADQAPESLIEVGPGKVLTGLMLRFNPALKPASTGVPALMDRAIAAHKPQMQEVAA